MSRSQDPCFILNSFPVGEKSTMLYCFTLGSGVLHLFANITPKKKKLCCVVFARYILIISAREIKKIKKHFYRIS